MTAWALWRQTRPLIAFVLVVELAAAIVTAVLFARTHLTMHDWLVFAALAVSGVAQAEIGRHVERLRRRLTDTPYINLTSVWTYAGVLVLPAALVATLTVVLYLQLNLRTARFRGVPAWRAVMNAAFVVITCYAARAVIAGLDLDGPRDLTARPVSGLVVISISLITYFVVGAVLVIPSIWARTHSLSAVVGTGADNVLELATLCFGAVLAAGVAHIPGLALIVVPPMAGRAHPIRGRTAGSPRRASRRGDGDRWSSVSIGVAGHPRQGASVDQVLHAADNALYRAKRGGRNQVVRAVDGVTSAKPSDSSRSTA